MNKQIKKRKQYLSPRMTVKKIKSANFYKPQLDGFVDLNEEMGIYLADLMYPGS